MTDGFGGGYDPWEYPSSSTTAVGVVIPPDSHRRLTRRDVVYLAVIAVLIVTIIILVVALVATQKGAPDPGTPSAASPTSSGEPVLPPEDVEAALETVLDAGAPPEIVAEYDRDAFGQTWADIDRNGCDTRNDILGRDLIDVVFKEGTGDCKVLSGTLIDPYTGSTIAFVAGSQADVVQIDHLVPLAWAWRNGADEWTDDERERFANDPANLLAVDGEANQEKSDAGPAGWMPPSSGYSCTYLIGFVQVVGAYELAIDDDDRLVARRLLESC